MAAAAGVDENSAGENGLRCYFLKIQYNKTTVDYWDIGYDVISTCVIPIFTFSGRYHIIFNASIVNNCIIYDKIDFFLIFKSITNLTRGPMVL